MDVYGSPTLRCTLNCRWTTFRPNVRDLIGLDLKGAAYGSPRQSSTLFRVHRCGSEGFSADRHIWGMASSPHIPTAKHLPYLKTERKPSAKALSLPFIHPPPKSCECRARGSRSLAGRCREISPVRPDAAEQIPEGAVTPTQTRTAGVALKDLDLMP